jgi:parvulin-like peptidyl-prolyl isomerase
MNTKTKIIFSAALAATLITLPRAQAATSGAAAPDAMATNAPATTAASATNSNPANVMAALFGDPVIAKGNGFEIKQSQLDAVMDAFKARAASMGQTIPPDEVTKTALNSLIVNQLLLQMANGADKAEGQKQADQYINQTVKHYGSQQSMEEQLRAAGKTYDGWRNEMTQQTTATAVLIRVLDAAPTDADVQKYYDENPKASQLPEEVHVRHILLLTIDPTTKAPLTDDQIKAKKKQIDDILKQARAGADFAALAKQYSEDPGSKDNGGELPPFAKASDDPNHAMVPEFEAAAFALNTNQISEVITTQYGYHIILLLDKTPARRLALNDKLPGSDTTMAEQIKNFLTEQKLREQAPAYIEKLSKSPGVDILDPALKTLMSQTNAPAAPMAQ